MTKFIHKIQDKVINKIRDNNDDEDYSLTWGFRWYMFKANLEERFPIINKIRYKYWEIVPYDWRPSNIWYKVKCFAWKRYSTVKSRHLPHTWIDKDMILVYTMFEVLDKFLEEECSPGVVDWYAEYEDGKKGHQIVVNGKEVNVMDEMLEIQAFWHRRIAIENDVIKLGTSRLLDAIESVETAWAERNKVDMSQHDKDNFLGIQTTDWFHKLPDEVRLDYYNSMSVIYQAHNKREEEEEQELEDYMIRLVRVRNFMWT